MTAVDQRSAPRLAELVATLSLATDLGLGHAVEPLVVPPVPPNPPRRRHAFKVGTAWLLAVAVLFVAGLDGLALGLGVMLVVACAAVTVANLCVPSETLAWIERRLGERAVATQ